MAIQALSQYLQKDDIPHKTFPISGKDPLGRVAMPIQDLVLEIVEIPNFDQWIERSRLWQFIIQFSEDSFSSEKIISLNHQLPIGFLSHFPNEKIIYFKYTLWLSNDEDFHKVSEAIHCIRTIIANI